jgi:hypothetical protein
LLYSIAHKQALLALLKAAFLQPVLAMPAKPFKVHLAKRYSAFNGFYLMFGFARLLQTGALECKVTFVLRTE